MQEQAAHFSSHLQAGTLASTCGDALDSSEQHQSHRNHTIYQILTSITSPNQYYTAVWVKGALYYSVNTMQFYIRTIKTPTLH